MTKQDWQTLGAIAAIGGAVVTLHGVTSKKWTEAHTFFALLAAVAYIAPRLDDLGFDI